MSSPFPAPITKLPVITLKSIFLMYPTSSFLPFPHTSYTTLSSPCPQHPHCWEITVLPKFHSELPHIHFQNRISNSFVISFFPPSLITFATQYFYSQFSCSIFFSCIKLSKQLDIQLEIHHAKLSHSNDVMPQNFIRQK